MGRDAQAAEDIQVLVKHLFVTVGAVRPSAKLLHCSNSGFWRTA